MTEYNTYPVWTQIDRPVRQYQWLESDISCSVCVVGGGVTGALCAMRLAESEQDVVLITAGRVGCGATASAMPCAEYDFGRTFRSFAARRGQETAAELLDMGAKAVDRLEQLSSQLDGDIGFTRRDAFLFTDDDNELEMLGKEYMARRAAGIDCAFVSRSAARDVFPFEVAGGIISKDMAAELDPYLLTQLCAAKALSLGARVYENTKAERIDPLEGGGVEISTATYHKIIAAKVVIAAGAACADIIDGITASKTCFMAVSPRIGSFSGWPGRCVVRSFSSPGVTYASSPDGRIFAAGLATSVVDEHSRLGGVLPMPSLHERRFAELEAGARYLFPSICINRFEYAMAARYCRTLDGLPIVGWSEESNDCIFAMCCGEGGVLMSEIASRTVAGLCAGEERRELALFHPGRRSLVR